MLPTKCYNPQHILINIIATAEKGFIVYSALNVAEVNNGFFLDIK